MSYAATIGFFDGVHRGHRFLLSEMRRTAALQGLQTAVITFADHPKAVLDGRTPPLLTTYDERIARLREQQPDEIYCFRFDIIRDMTAAEFMAVLHRQCQVDTLVMGYDQHFGSDRITDFDNYRRLGEQAGLRLITVPQSPEGDISSSKIRTLLQQGGLTDANALLGYEYSLTGKVVHGRGIGSQIGFPTANIQTPPDKLLPKAGVYAAVTDGRKAVVNIGTNPTVGGTETTVEMHLPHYNGSLYGETVTVRLLRRLRDEITFADTDALCRQIEQDIEKLDFI